jgi:serine/threonine protein kinase/Flp pilus assembly protein TadD
VTDDPAARRWREIEAILDDAFERPPAERAAFVHAACAGDPDLHALVAELLAADERSLGPLERSPHADFGEPDPSAAAPNVPGYRIVRKLGEGGMGVVFEAEQESPRRSVALKLIRSGVLAGQGELRAFRREIFSLARLKHAGIATIHDAGRTPEGVQYLVMELVQGRRLDEHVASLPGPADRGGLDARLDVFLEIADAIGHAHQRGIIHRDLKPSNVMVTEAPRDSASGRPRAGVKVLDFGLARIEAADAEHSLMAMSGRILGTPAYMSPEQARGDPGALDVRTDVYSLGVMLYEMLAGRTPHDVTGRPVAEALRILTTEPPPRLRDVARGIPEDLETIVHKAIDPDPAARYAGVAAMAEDVRRFRADLPILARKPSTLYQLRKIVARHTAAFAFAATLAVLVTASAVAMFILYRAQRRATDTAELQTRKAERTLAFFQEILASADPAVAGGEELTVKELVRRSAAKVDSSFAEDADVRAAIQYTVGTMELVLGSYDQAAARLRTALATRAAAGDDNPEAIDTLEGLATAEIARGEAEAAEALARRAVEASRSVHGDTSGDVARLLGVLGGALEAGAKYAEAESTFHRALAVHDSLAAPDPAGRAGLLTNLAGVHAGRGQYEEAVAKLSEAARVQREAGLGDRPAAIMTRFNLAVRLGDLQRFQESVPILREVLEAQTRVLGPEHPHTLRTLAALGFHLAATEGWGEAEKVLADAARRTRQVNPGSPNLAVALQAQAYALGELNRHAEAEPLLRESLAIFREVLGERHPQTATLMHNLGWSLFCLGRRDEALPLLRAALEIRLELFDETHPHVKDSRDLVARAEAAGEAPDR